MRATGSQSLPDRGSAASVVACARAALGWAVQAKTLETPNAGTGKTQTTACNVSLCGQAYRLTTSSDLVVR